MARADCVLAPARQKCHLSLSFLHSTNGLTLHSQTLRASGPVRATILRIPFAMASSVTSAIDMMWLERWRCLEKRGEEVEIVIERETQ